VHPFQFRNNVYTDELYEAEVRVCAQAFVQDAALKAKVQGVAQVLFAALAASPNVSEQDTQTFDHGGVTFTVCCARTLDKDKSRDL
jgi:hypothetical protein